MRLSPGKIFLKSFLPMVSFAKTQGNIKIKGYMSSIIPDFKYYM